MTVEAGAQEFARYQRVLYGFRQDWRQLWSLFADTDRGVRQATRRIGLGFCGGRFSGSTALASGIGEKAE